MVFLLIYVSTIYIQKAVFSNSVRSSVKLSRNAACRTVYQRIRKNDDNNNKICVGQYLYIGNVQLQFAMFFTRARY